jgi:serine/threonine-protein kinase
MSDETEFVPDIPAFGRFRVIGALGAGTMGTVYRARDDELGRDVAIKTLRGAGGDPLLRERFLREARAIGRVPHPHILDLFDLGTQDGVPYLVMELAAGGSLRALLGRGRLPVEEARRLGIQIARALAAAHAHGILHRDVKPANILSTEPGTWKLADFGIAHLPGSDLTTPGQFLGSPAYAAPEYLTEGRFGAASDVYGVGATLFEALTGATPHGDLPLAARIEHARRGAPPIATRLPLPPPLAAAIDGALSTDPARRPGAAALADRLAARDPAARAAAPPARSRRRAILFALLAAAALTGLAAASLCGRRGAPPAGEASGSPSDPPAD